jgi:predicted nucleic acid-binding protein
MPSASSDFHNVRALNVPSEVRLKFGTSGHDRSSRYRRLDLLLALKKARHDLMIAAVALANGLIVVTHNTTEFRRVQGLQDPSLLRGRAGDAT